MPSSNHHRSSHGAVRRTRNAPTGAGSPTSSNIRVVVRIRPPNAAELENGSGSRPIVRMLDEKVLVFDPKEDDMPSYFHGRRIAKRNFMQRKNKDVRFAFDHVFGDGVTQQFVYENTTKSIIESVLAGYNASVFAYGATGAGKTFTMLGAPDCPGVIFLTMVELYRRIGEIAQEKLCDVAVSYLEVYNENIRDLLTPSGLLAIREDPEKGVVVSGLTLHKPRNAEELLRMLEFGNSNRTQHPTDANAQSSRSHAVFQVFVRQKDRTANISASFRIAKMSLIDLAGSERATVTTNRGARFREGANINRSLLALGNCINALADTNKSKSQHIPYRNSKLTRLLKDSLGGNCQTVMIAAVSPSSLTYEDTLNTLKYANRAKNIRTTLKQNVVSVDLHISRYAQIVEELRTEVTELKTKLQSYETGAVSIERSLHPSPDGLMNERTQRLRLELSKVFAQRGSIQKELLELESSDRHLAVMICRKQLMAERISLVYGDSVQGDKTMGRFERHIAASSKRQARLRERKPAVQERLRSNEEWLDRLKAEMRTGKEDGTPSMPTVLQESMRTHHLEIELKDCRRQIKHLKRFARQQDSHHQSSERLIVRLLSTVRKQFFLLKGSDLATSDVTAAFEAVQKQVEGDREVAWADQSAPVDTMETGPAIATEMDLNSLLELPVMKCRELTPNAPSRSPHKRRRTNTYSPGNHASAVATNQLSQTPTTPGGVRTPTQYGTPASRVPRQQTDISQPAARLQTPKTATPLAARSPTPFDTVTKLSAANTTRNTAQPNPLISQVAGITADVSQTGNKVVRDTETGSGVLPSAGETVTKKRPSLSAENLPGFSTSTTEELGSTRQNLSQSFDMDGICPLRASPDSANIPAPPVTNEDTHVIRTDQSQPHSLAPVSPPGNVASTDDLSVPGDESKPVARAISFDQENALPNQKISPVTGRVMSYAEVLTTPQRLDAGRQQRAPFAVLTNNSPQLQNRAVVKATHLLTPDEFTTRRKAAGNQFAGNQSKPSKSLQRHGTFTKRSPPLHRRSKSQGMLGERPFPSQEAKHAETLHRFGLPSMSDQPTGMVRRAKPAYMSMTASAANKRRNHSKGFAAMQENQPPVIGRGPLRLQRTENAVKPAVRTQAFSRSRSVGNLHGKMNP